MSQCLSLCFQAPHWFILSRHFCPLNITDIKQSSFLPGNISHEPHNLLLIKKAQCQNQRKFKGYRCDGATKCAVKSLCLPTSGSSLSHLWGCQHTPPAQDSTQLQALCVLECCQPKYNLSKTRRRGCFRINVTHVHLTVS